MLDVKSTVLPLHDDWAMVIVGITAGLIAMVMLFDDAVIGLAQARLDVIVQLTTCPFVRAVVE
jgi:hypothetical protein